jgi:AcrR family transcriptional regulator
MEVDPSRGHPTSKAERGDQTRATLVAVARKLFSTRGYAETSLDRLTCEAGVTKGALYHHFRDKPALFEAVLADCVRGVGREAKRLSKQRMSKQGLPRRGWERIDAIVDVALDQLCEPSLVRIALVDGPAVLGHERCDRVWAENMIGAIHRLLGSTEESPGVSAEHLEPLSRLLLGALQEAAVVLADASNSTDARETYRNTILWLLRAIHAAAISDAEELS